jgi:hypothetical protein
VRLFDPGFGGTVTGPHLPEVDFVADVDVDRVAGDDVRLLCDLLFLPVQFALR